ncbi:TrkH family potassium uptake protein [Natranaerobius trueperi]|uniref:Potassium transporter n=1 Tax=Natranaerobius trueperi TaxID=759412 RepID=A0A226C3E8_9FIRM|nr:potassium transporter TrkG [Natranaerobius trueperi]OWZ84989.1 potassium transporter [Natranaerobius trueperi]
MNTKNIVKMLGYFLFYFGLTIIIPLLWSIFDDGPGKMAFSLTMIFTVSLGWVLKIFVNADEEDISLKDGFAIVTFSWILAATIGAAPYLIVGVFESFVDAFFEAMSGFSTTGATLIDDIESLPKDILLWRSMTQWLGGMGIVVLFVALFPRLGVKGMQLLKAEVPGPVTEKIVPRVAKTAKVLWIIYVVISIIQVFSLMLVEVDFYTALNHAFTTMPTGGFSTFNDSISGFNSIYVEMIILVFMVIAGANFALYYSLVKGNIKTVTKNEELRFYLGGIIVFTLLIATHLYFNGTVESYLLSLRQASFQVVSIITTTGYATENFELWTPFARQLLFFLMFFGGSGGSTGGSIKQIRILTIIKQGVRELYRLIHPNAVIPVKLNGRAIKEPVISSIVGYVVLYMCIFLLSSLLVSLSGLDMISSFSAVAATLGNVGPGLGAVGPIENYDFFSGPIKILLSFLMLIGRLEVYTVAVMVLPEFRQFKSRKLI